MIIKNNKKTPIVYDFNSFSTSWLLNYSKTKDPEEADIIIFPGGADIQSSLYGQKPSISTFPSMFRDEIEGNIHDKYVGKKAMIGICRGMQLTFALNGATLIQDIAHPGRHGMIDYEGNTIIVNSLHHQQVCLNNLKPEEYKLLGWSTAKSPYYIGEADKPYDFPEDYKEPEAAVLLNKNIIGFQFHPEMMAYSGDYKKTIDWCIKQVDKFLTY